MSKTVIFNAIVLIAGVGTYLLDHELVQQNPKAVALLTAAVGGLNLVLRYMTVAPMQGWLSKTKPE